MLDHQVDQFFERNGFPAAGKDARLAAHMDAVAVVVVSGTKVEPQPNLIWSPSGCALTWKILIVLCARLSVVSPLEVLPSLIV